MLRSRHLAHIRFVLLDDVCSRFVAYILLVFLVLVALVPAALLKAGRSHSLRCPPWPHHGHDVVMSGQARCDHIVATAQPRHGHNDGEACPGVRISLTDLLEVLP